jgi:hypothetical protein
MEMDDSHLNWMSCCYDLDEIWQSFIELCVLNATGVSRDCQISFSGLSKVVVSMADICCFG